MPGNEDVLAFESPMALLHRPDADHDPASDAEDSTHFSQSLDPTLRRGHVVDDGHGEDGVEAGIPERKREIVAEQHLQYYIDICIKTNFVFNLGAINRSLGI